MCVCVCVQDDLHEFLTAHSPTCDASVSAGGGGSDDGTVSILEQADFLYIATQIAAGAPFPPSLSFPAQFSFQWLY